MNLYFKKPNGRYIEATSHQVTECATEYATLAANRQCTIKSPKDTEALIVPMLVHAEAEKFVVVFLDNRHRVIATDIMFEGTIDGTSVYPREVVKAALSYNAAAIILAHNHPSGVAEPSQADERITQRLKSALELVDVRLLDHLIVGGNTGTVTSLASRGSI